MKKYIDEFLRLKASMDILPFFLQGKNGKVAKEITESWAMFNAAKNVLKTDTQDRILCIIVGDGRKPRTGGLISHLTKWAVISIDPQFDNEWINDYWLKRIEAGTTIQRLGTLSSKIEDLKPIETDMRVVMLLPHSHANLDNCVKYVKTCKQLDLVSMPCCTKIPSRWLCQDFSIKHNLIYYIDDNVWSPKNSVYIWQNLKGDNL